LPKVKPADLRGPAGGSEEARPPRASSYFTQGGLYARGVLESWRMSSVSQQILPIIRRIASVQPLPEHGIRVSFGTCFSQRVFVVQPSKDYDTGSAVKTEKHPESLHEFCPPPVTVFVTKRIALLKPGIIGIRRNDLEHQFIYGCEYFCFWMAAPSSRIVKLKTLHFPRQFHVNFGERR
jgi:hypothetical protein